MPPRPSLRRETVGIALGGLVLLVLVGGLIGYVAFRDDEDAASEATRVVTTAEEEPGTTATTAETEEGAETAGSANAAVPRVVGLGERQARAALGRAGYEVVADRQPSDRPEGIVVAQEPPAGAELARGETVAIAVSSGVAPSGEGEVAAPTAEVPGVLDIGFVDAANQIEARGFVADTYVVSSREPRGAVVGQKPAPGTMLPTDRPVRLNVALGTGPRELARVPDVTGPEERGARDAARRAGFTTRTVDRDAPSGDEVGKVIFQQPAAGTVAPVLTQVVLYVGRRPA